MVIYKVVKSSSRQTISHTVTPTLGLSKKKGYHTSGNFHNDHDVKLKKQSWPFNHQQSSLRPVAVPAFCHEKWSDFSNGTNILAFQQLSWTLTQCNLCFTIVSLWNRLQVELCEISSPLQNRSLHEHAWGLCGLWSKYLRPAAPAADPGPIFASWYFRASGFWIWTCLPPLHPATVCHIFQPTNCRKNEPPGQENTMALRDGMVPCDDNPRGLTSLLKP